jgi:4-carboxymuconolactone decarboxylase
MPYEIARALDNGVTPAEIPEVITHLALYSGWANAMSAVAVTKDVFTERGVTARPHQQVPLSRKHPSRAPSRT